MKIMLLGDKTLMGHMGTAYRGFTKLGHVVSYIPTRIWLESASESSIRKSEMGLEKKQLACWKAIVHATKLFKPDIIIHCQAWNIPTDCIEQFKEIAPTIYWTVDDPHQLIVHRHNDLWKNYDGILSCCKECVSFYENKAEIPSLLFYPPMVDPTVIYPKKPIKELNTDVCFAFAQLYVKEFWGKTAHWDGVIHQERIDAWFTEYVPRKFLIMIATKYGSTVIVGLRDRFRDMVKGWGDLRIFKPRSNEHLSEIFSSAKINVNSHAWPTYHGYLNKRTWLILASKGFQLCDKVDGIEEVFKLNKHLVVYSNLEEYEDKLIYYLRHDSKRNEIAKQGYDFVLKNYRNDMVCKEVIGWLKKTFLVK